MRKPHEPCPRCRSKGSDSRGDNLKLFPNGTKHCFACGYHENPAWEGPEKALKRAQERLNVPEGILPADFTRDVPTDAWKWLLQYGLPYSHWKESCGYSPKEGRLYFLVPSGGAPLFSQGRLIEGNGAKWFNRGDSHKAACFVGKPNGLLSPTVLVEDWISCNKVGQVEETLCLFGVEIHPAHIYFLNDKSKRPIIMWLDKDQEGRSSKKAARLAMLTGRPVKLLHTNNDPKACSFEEIKNVLCENV